MILPVVIYYIIFHYVPMYGVQIAFKDYVGRLGIWGSQWNHFAHFKRFFSSYKFSALLKNTLTLSIYSLLVSVPIPIIFALLLNYLPGKRFRKFIQMVSYAPNFISMMVLCGMITIFFFPGTGIINQIIQHFGGESIPFLSSPQYYRHLFVWSGVWQSMGFRRSCIFLRFPVLIGGCMRPLLLTAQPSFRESGISICRRSCQQR